MSIKQMYVKNEDLEIYTKDEKYGTSFANVVVEALREYVKQQERNRDTEGYSPILLEVGRYHPLPTRTSLKSFWGKQIANYEEDQDDPRQGEGFHIKAGV